MVPLLKQNTHVRAYLHGSTFETDLIICLFTSEFKVNKSSILFPYLLSRATAVSHLENDGTMGERIGRIGRIETDFFS
jgi:hypothetical protein